MADNSSRKFKFISPGVFIDEIDNSQLPAEPTSVGPMIIGRARKGPAMKPVQVNSFNDFVDTFGNPVAGGSGGDVWRDGNTTSPMYAPYAAQAWLRNNSPLTFMRLVGQQDSNADATNRNGQAGWYGGNEGKESGFSFSTPADGGAWALCVFPTSSGVQVDVTGAVAAVFYADAGRLMLSGNTAANAGLGALTASACTVFQTGNGDLTLAVSKAGVDSVSVFQKKSFSLRPDSANFIRNVFNTNPTIVNDEITTPAAQSASLGGQFWLGQSYERSLSGQGINSLGILSDDLGSGYSACLINQARTIPAAQIIAENPQGVDSLPAQASFITLSKPKLTSERRALGGWGSDFVIYNCGISIKYIPNKIGRIRTKTKRFFLEDGYAVNARFGNGKGQIPIACLEYRTSRSGESTQTSVRRSIAAQHQPSSICIKDRCYGSRHINLNSGRGGEYAQSPCSAICRGGKGEAALFAFVAAIPAGLSVAISGISIRVLLSNQAHKGKWRVVTQPCLCSIRSIHRRGSVAITPHITARSTSNRVAKCIHEIIEGVNLNWFHRRSLPCSTDNHRTNTGRLSRQL